MDPNFNRRQFIGLAVCVAVNTALTGCKKKEPEWTVAKDNKLNPLAFEISEGKATPPFRIRLETMRRLHSSPAFRQLHSGSQDCESETKKGNAHRLCR